VAHPGWRSAIAALLAAGCCELTAVAVDVLTIAALAGDGQTSPVGDPLPVPPSVRITNQRGLGVAGVPIVFAIAAGGGTVAGPSQITDAGGVATVGGWTLGTAPGPNSLIATAQRADVSGNPVTFSAVARAGAAATLSRHAGDGQTAPVGEVVPIPPAVRLTDRFGNPVAGVQIVFSVAAGGGSLTGATQMTGADGVAAVGSWTLGAVPGPNGLAATAAGPGIAGNPTSFTATATTGPPAAIQAQAGDAQTARVGTAVPVPPAVLVRDRFGNPAPNLAVTFAVTAGGGSVTGGSATTGADGIATVGSWILGPNPGPNALTATAAGSGIQGNPVTFTATGIAPPGPAPARIEPGPPSPRRTP
jgi:adhesin/invasin